MAIVPALIMIDMQNGFLNEASAQCVPTARDTVPACAQVIEHCHKTGIPVFFVTRTYRADGSDVEFTRYGSWQAGSKALSPGCPDAISAAYPPEFQVWDGDYHVNKPRFSAFFQTELDLLLRRKGINTLLLAGTTTPNCIRTTCYDAICLDYNVAVLSDCTSAATPEIQRVNLEDMGRVGACILSSKALLAGEAIPDLLAHVQTQVRQNEFR